MTKQGNRETFVVISNEWLEILKPQLKMGSVAKYNNILTNHLNPEFGLKNMDDISRKDVIEYSGKLLTLGGRKSTGLSPKTVTAILSVLKNIFDYAEREKGLELADIRNISVKQPQKPMRILSIAEQQRLSKYLLSNITSCNLGILLCLYTGLRIGEICALRWEDICFDEQYIYIHQTMQRIQTQERGKRKTRVMILPPKSDCSIRKIPLPNEMFELLLSSRMRDRAYLLTGKIDKYMEPRTLENHFKSITQKCNISNVHFHTLRHTFATRCVELGFDVKSLSEILGHSSVNITLNRYVHPSMELKQKNMNMLSKLLRDGME